MTKPDFGGYATKNNIECLDGRTIRQDAFKHQNGTVVPLAWMHNSGDPSTILGHAVLENREDGVYANCFFNKSQNADIAKDLIKHGAIKALSIYANRLKQAGKDVKHGIIREVSLVMGGSNPGALIDTISFAHGDYDDDVDEAVITSGELILMHSADATEVVEEAEVVEEVVEHAEEEVEEEDEEKTVGDTLATLNDEQKAVVGYLLEVVSNDEDEDETEDNDAQHSEEDPNMVKKNVFDQSGDAAEGNYLTHDDFKTIVSIAQRTGGSMKDAFIAHTEETGLELMHAGGTVAGYGIENIGYLFPEARNVTTQPTFIQREQGWVDIVLKGTRHTPFSRIKSMHADITADEARAKGYVTGNRKTEEVFNLLKRTTTPTTVYKKQKLDRDDVLDITDFDVVVWLKAEMRVMLNEELGRAILIGDGRSAVSEDKISETNIRPIAFDDELYTIKKDLAADVTPEDMIDDVLRARKDWKGTGSPSLFVSSAVLTEWLLVKDSLGYRIYKTKADLESAMNVKEIVVVDVMTEDTAYDETSTIAAIMVNLNDYTIGADKGGEINMFDDFDIDFNQQKYLMETRVSGALTVPYSAIVFVKANPVVG